MKLPLPLSSLLAVPLALGGCSGGTPAAAESSGSKISVVTGVYPLQYLAERIGGNRVAVTNLTQPGAEPHDLELTPQNAAALSKASVVITVPGFQPAIDEAAQQNTGALFDASSSAQLVRGDRHFWLDPTRMADVADAVAARLAQTDPAGKDTYTANAANLRAELQTLDADIRTGTTTCANRTLVVSHEAFGYLAERYRLTQVGISGVSPDAEPSPARIAEVTTTVKNTGVKTIYTETLASPAFATTVANQTGAKVATLDPIEGLSDASAARDYPGLMRANLAAIRQGQPCS